ncbi:MAG: AI-2E family transporter [Gammaproteobacteria bacterium]|nr:AI-2E family transporter [Gammaproteobacteria bacterium]
MDRWFWMAIAIVAGYLIYLLSPVLTPFLVGAILAYIADPLADLLELKGLSRNRAVVLVFSVLSLVGLGILVVLIPLIQQQIVLFVTKLPHYLNWLQQEGIPALQQSLPFELDFNLLLEQLKQQLEGGSKAVFSILSVVSQSGFTLLGWLANLVLIPLVSFYLLLDWDHFTAHVHRLVPRKYADVVGQLAHQSDDVLANFFRGQLMVMSVLATIYTIGLWIIGLEFALLIGLIAGLVSFVPYLGLIVGMVIAAVAAVMQFHELMPIFYIAFIFGGAQLIEGFVLTPLLLGDKIGLHPVVVIFAVLAGGELFGFFGMLLALPVAAVVMVLLRHSHQQYINSEIYSSE